MKVKEKFNIDKQKLTVTFQTVRRKGSHDKAPHDVTMDKDALLTHIGKEIGGGTNAAVYERALFQLQQIEDRMPGRGKPAPLGAR